MEFIDKTLISKQERLDRTTNEILEDLVHTKETKFDKYVPTQEHLDYLHKFKSLNPAGMSKGNSFTVMCSFPMEVHVKMTNLHGPHWADKPGVLQEFMRKNPQYCMANSKGLEKFDKVLGKIEVNENINQGATDAAI
jgi:hypothetical protein